MTDAELRQPAHDNGAEMAALGAMMLSRDALVEISEILTHRSFYRPIHGQIFDTVVDLDARGEPADAFMVAAALDSASALARIGGGNYLHTLIASVPTAANGTYYARIVADRALSREIQAAGERISHLASTGRAPTDALQEAMHLLADLDASATTTESAYRMWGDIVPEVLAEIERAGELGGETPGIPTGFADLDRLLNGLRPGQVVIVGARPGCGKTVFAAGVAQYVSWKRKLPSILFSLEMTAVELGQRMISADSRVPLHVLQTGALTDGDWARVIGSAGESAEAPMAVDDTAELSIGEIRARSRKFHRQCGELGLVVVDHLGLVVPTRGENRQVAVAGISRGLKLLSKQLNVPVLVTAQLNRNSEGRASKVPELADLRESGAIEQDADVVILLHREDYHDPESSRAGEADLMVKKNRSGPTDTITVAAQLHLSRFVDMAVA